MTAIYVCPLSRLSETVARSGARHILTLINEGTVVVRPEDVSPDNHLRIGIHDIVEPADGMVCPSDAHVTQVLDFIRRWDRQAPIVVHCYAGVSRSTAAAYTAFCAVRPDADEAVVAERLRSRSPEATPNARLVAMADELLGRNGRMVRAVQAIGRGTDCFEGTVFSLRLNE